MAFELKDGYGSLFKNRDKQQENHADYNGDFKIDGKEYWLNAWVKDGKNGKFFSLSVKPKDSQRAPRPTAPHPQDPDDPIPF